MPGICRAQHDHGIPHPAAEAKRSGLSTIGVCAGGVLYGHVHTSNRVNIHQVNAATPVNGDAKLHVANSDPLHGDVTGTNEKTGVEQPVGRTFQQATSDVHIGFVEDRNGRVSGGYVHVHFDKPNLAFLGHHNSPGTVDMHVLEQNFVAALSNADPRKDGRQ